MKLLNSPYLPAILISLILTSCSGETSFSDILKQQGKDISNMGTNYENGQKMMVEGNQMIKDGNQKMQDGVKLTNEGQALAASGTQKAEEGRLLMLNSTALYNNTITNSPYYANQPR